MPATHGATDVLSVEFACKWCGRSLVVTTLDSGSEIADRDAFLSAHEKCLHRAMGPRLDEAPPAPRTGS
jgi:hypothetical protein